jgi:hypothetical protein
VITDPFLGTLYSEDYDEQVRPQRHASNLRPFTGSYEVIVDAREHVLAPSMKAARAHMLEQLEAAAVTPADDECEALIRAVGIAPGLPHRAPHVPVLEGAPAYTWFAMRKDPDFRRELLDLSSHFRQTLGDATATSTPAPPKRQRRPRRYAVRYALLFECARELWARDAEHAELLLQEDVGVLLTMDCLDRWTDDQTGYGWRLEEVALAEDAA